MADLLEVKNYMAEIISPIHVGSGEKASVVDYVFHDGQLFVINLEKLVRDLTPQQCRIFSDQLIQTRSLLQSFQALKITPNDYRKYAKYVVECQFQPLELHLAVKNAQNMPYIPGSSIKGALRTALCYNLLFTSPKSMQLLKRRIYKVLFRRNAEKFLRNIVESFFGSVKGRHSPHYDVMKFLRISDSSSLLQEKLIVREVSMIETRGYVAQRKTGLRTHVEVIKPGTTLYGKITLDKTIVKEGYSRYAMDFPMLNIITNLKIITSYANKFASDLIDHEIEFSETYGFSGLKHFYMNLKQNILQKLDEGQFLLRVGWGSGYLATTIGLLLKKEHDLFRDIRRRFKLGDRRAPTFPLSRKVILEDNDMIPLGWVKFTVMD